jgi:hypothetical protein
LKDDISALILGHIFLYFFSIFFLNIFIRLFVGGGGFQKRIILLKE